MRFNVEQLRRYPVKSMGGEALTSIELTSRGLVGDRHYAVRDAGGYLVSGKNTKSFRRHDEIFELRAETIDGQVRVHRGDASWLATSPELAAQLTELMGEPMRVVEDADASHFDDGSVSLIGTATLEWWRQRGIDADPRRLRVNIVTETAEPFEEENWIGSELVVGGARLRAVQRVPRCRMVDVPQDGAAAEQKWLKLLAQERGMCAAIYADVVEPGTLAVGDELRVIFP